MGLKSKRLYKWLIFLILTCFFLFFVPGCEKNNQSDKGFLSEGNSGKIEESGSQSVLRFTTMDVAPFGYLTEKGEPSGILSEVADYIGKELNCLIIHEVAPFSRCMHQLETGDSDIWIGLPNKLVMENGIRVGDFLEFKGIVVGRSGTYFGSLEDLHGKTIATISDAQYDPSFTRDVEITKYPTGNYNQNLKMLFSGRVDGVVGPEVGLFYTLRKMGYDRSVLGEPYCLDSIMSGIFYSKKSYDPEMAEKIKELSSTPQFKRDMNAIVDRYVNGP